MPSERFEFGDRVRHPKRPEWGVGSVVKAQDEAQGATAGQRLSVRFTNAGLKVIQTSAVGLERIIEEQAGDAAEDEQGSIREWDRLQESGWLTSVAERKIGEAMISIPEAARDPFSPLETRLEATFRLYRFDRTGGSLIDWAVAQSGLEDPLSRFTRHELEELFDRWALERDTHLHRLLQEPKAATPLVERLLESAPPAARQAVKRQRSMR